MVMAIKNNHLLNMKRERAKAKCKGSWQRYSQDQTDKNQRAFPRVRFKLESGTQIRFWEDIWLGTTTLRRSQHPILFNIGTAKQVTIVEVPSFDPLNLECMRHFNGLTEQQWQELLAILNLKNKNQKCSTVMRLQITCFSIALLISLHAE